MHGSTTTPKRFPGNCHSCERHSPHAKSTPSSPTAYTSATACLWSLRQEASTLQLSNNPQKKAVLLRHLDQDPKDRQQQTIRRINRYCRTIPNSDPIQPPTFSIGQNQLYYAGVVASTPSTVSWSASSCNTAHSVTRVTRRTAPCSNCKTTVDSHRPATAPLLRKPSPISPPSATSSFEPGPPRGNRPLGLSRIAGSRGRTAHRRRGRLRTSWKQQRLVETPMKAVGGVQSTPQGKNR